MEVLPRYLQELSDETKQLLCRNGLARRGRDGNLFIDSSIMAAEFNRAHVGEIIRASGVPDEAVGYYIYPEIHSVSFRMAFSLAFRSIPVPGIWDVLAHFDPHTRFEIVHDVYDTAFPGDKGRPVRLSDPLFVLRR